ncbi:MAG TPA: T9SS type A sorting domain-containing protein, partial [Hymenobacter sp.]|nr:T9SS type A sorting domain-containing protein [Hymenobacter sp.]
WDGGSTQPVTWDVAGTTANGVNCAQVNIRLSTDGGLTYPTVLAANVPNSGTATVTVPSVATTTARIMVEAVGNYFFDISNANFTIASPTACVPPTALAVSSLTNTSASVAFTASSTATRYVVTTTPATTTQTVTASPVNLTGLTPGTTYTVQIVSDCGSGSTSVAATTTFTTTAPAPCIAPSELAVSNLTLTSATVSFLGATSATSYTVTTIPATTTQTVTTSPVNLTGLTPATSYTVRVVANCAGGATSTASATLFRTLAPPPVNDLCSAALPLTCGVSVTGTTAGSTATGDPTLSCGGTSVDQGGVFYSLVGTGSRISLTTCGPITDYDTKLFVYQGTCGGPYTCVAGNDDTNTGSCGVPSTVSFTSTSGATYLVFVSGYENEQGRFSLLATCDPLSSKSAKAQAAFQVWPNPVGAQAAFRVELPAAAVAATATLHNVLGQQVAQRTFTGASTEVSTAGLASGTYLLTVRVAGQAPAVRRVVVE